MPLNAAVTAALFRIEWPENPRPQRGEVSISRILASGRICTLRGCVFHQLLSARLAHPSASADVIFAIDAIVRYSAMVYL